MQNCPKFKITVYSSRIQVQCYFKPPFHCTVDKMKLFLSTNICLTFFESCLQRHQEICGFFAADHRSLLFGERLWPMVVIKDHLSFMLSWQISIDASGRAWKNMENLFLEPRQRDCVRPLLPNVWVSIWVFCYYGLDEILLLVIKITIQYPKWVGALLINSTKWVTVKCQFLIL